MTEDQDENFHPRPGTIFYLKDDALEELISGMANDITTSQFPQIWAIKEVQETDKEEMAGKMFRAGAIAALKNFIQTIKKDIKKEKQ